MADQTWEDELVINTHLFVFTERYLKVKYSFLETTVLRIQYYRSLNYRIEATKICDFNPCHNYLQITKPFLIPELSSCPENVLIDVNRF